MGDIISGCHSECTRLLNVEEKNQVQTNYNKSNFNQKPKKITFISYVKSKLNAKKEIFPLPPTLHELSTMSFTFLQAISAIKIQRNFRLKYINKRFKQKIKPCYSNDDSDSNTISILKHVNDDVSIISNKRELVSLKKNYNANNKLYTSSGTKIPSMIESLDKPLINNFEITTSNTKSKVVANVRSQNKNKSSKSIRFNLLQDSKDISSNKNNSLKESIEMNSSAQRLKIITPFVASNNINANTSTNIHNNEYNSLYMSTTFSCFNDDWDILSMESENPSLNSDITFGLINNNSESKNNKQHFYFTKNYSGLKTEYNGINKVRQGLLNHLPDSIVKINFSDENILDNLEISKTDKGSYCIISFRNQSQFKGVVLGGLPHGIGALSLGNDIYYGDFKNGQLVGFGSFINSAGVIYEGDWSNGKQFGIGIEKCYDNCMFIGMYVDGFKQGIGTYSWSDGSIYEGEWYHNKFNGYGRYIFSNGNTYLGEWSESKMRGFGEFHWKDGKFYIGYFDNNKKTGFGIYVWNNPIKVFIGYWTNGKQDGLGKYISKRTVKYGYWKNGDRLAWLEKADDIKQHISITKKNYINKIFKYNIEELSEFLSVSI